MSQELYEERLGHVENGLAGLKADVRVLGHDVAGLKSDFAKVGDGVGKLLDREARRPEISLTVIGGTAGALVSIAVVVWWLIGHSPAVQALENRVMRLDDPEVGRVSRVERELGWTARITKN
jgi:hypothetical protein